MATLDQIKDGVFDWVGSVTPGGTPIDWEDGDDADRTITRVSLRLVRDTADAPADSVLDPDNSQETITERATFNLVINTRGAAAEDIARPLRASLYASGRFGFNALWGIVGLGGVTPLLNLSELEDSFISSRYEFRVTLNTTLDYIFGADHADTVSVTVNEGNLGVILDNQNMGEDPHPIPEGC